MAGLAIGESGGGVLSGFRRDWAEDRGALLRTAGPLAALALMIVVFTALNSTFLSVDNWLNIMRQSSVLLVVAVAGTYVILMGSIDLSVGSTLTLSAIAGAVLLRDHGNPWLLLLVPLIGLVCGAVNGFIFAWGGLPSFLVTLGTLFAYDGVSLYVSSGQPISVREQTGLTEFLNGTAVWRLPNIALVALVICVLSMLVARQTRFGRFMYAIGDGERVARLAGVAVRRFKLYAFMVSGTLAAIAGLMLMARVQSGSPRVGEPFLLTSLAAIVMGGTPLTGGVGGPHRTLLGVVLVSVLTNGMSIANVDPYLQVVVQGAVVVAAVALTLDRRKLSLVK